MSPRSGAVGARGRNSSRNYCDLNGRTGTPGREAGVRRFLSYTALERDWRGLEKQAAETGSTGRISSRNVCDLNGAGPGHGARTETHNPAAVTLGNPYAEEEYIPQILMPLGEPRRRANEIKRQERIIVVIGYPWPRGDVVDSAGI